MTGLIKSHIKALKRKQRSLEEKNFVSRLSLISNLLAYTETCILARLHNHVSQFLRTDLLIYLSSLSLYLLLWRTVTDEMFPNFHVTDSQQLLPSLFLLQLGLMIRIPILILPSLKKKKTLEFIFSHHNCY